MAAPVRLGALVMVALLAGCAAPAADVPVSQAASQADSDSSAPVEPANVPSSEPTAALTPSPPPAPTPTEAPTPESFTSARVEIVAGDLTLAHDIGLCPIRQGAAEFITGATFGTRESSAPGSDGREWATQLVVMRVEDGVPVDWSFILSTPPGVPSAQNDRRLTSSPGVLDVTMSLEITEARAVFTTAFLDPVRPFADRLLPGTVTLTCS